MSTMASQVTGVRIVCPAVCSGIDQRKHQSSTSLAFVRGIHQWPVDSHHKGPVTWKMFPFDDIIMVWVACPSCLFWHLSGETSKISWGHTDFMYVWVNDDYFHQIITWSSDDLLSKYIVLFPADDGFYRWFIIDRQNNTEYHSNLFCGNQIQILMQANLVNSMLDDASFPGVPFINTSRLRQNGSHVADNILKSIFLVENHILIQFSLKFVPKDTVRNKATFK